MSYQATFFDLDLSKNKSDLSRSIISLFLVFLIISYAGVGRDLFFNRLASASMDDPIGAYLVYVRCLTGFCCVVLVSLRRWLRGANMVFPWPFVPFSLLLLLSTSWADEPKDVAREAIQFSIFIWALFCCCFELGSKTVFRLICWTCAIAIVFSAVVAILVPSIGRHSGLELIQYSHVGRWKGIFSHKNTLGPWSAICFFLYLVLLTNRSVQTALGLVVLSSAFLCLIFCDSATSLIMALFMVSAYALISVRRLVSMQLILLISAIIVAAGLSVYFLVLDDIFIALGRNSNLTGRTDLWSIAIDVFFEAPFVGQGYGLAGGKIFNGLASGLVGSTTTGPDSGYLLVILETGLFGALFLFAPLIYCVFCGIRLCDAGDGERYINQAMLCVSLGVLLLAYTEGTALGPTSSVGSLCLSPFVLLLVAHAESKERRLARSRLRMGRPSAQGAGP